MKKTSLSLALLLAGGVAHADPADVDARMGRAARAIEPVKDVAKMTPAEHAALLRIAHDPAQGLYARARAIGLVGAIPNDAAYALWALARTWREPELRVQAAWAEGTARAKTAQALPYARALLHDDDVRLREVGVHLLFLQGTTDAVAAAKAHAAREPDLVVRALVERRLRERAAGKAITAP